MVQRGLVVLAATVGGAINAIAGGGTLVTFPALIGLGAPSIVANATSTVALWPGMLSSLWGYRQELAGSMPWAGRFAVPSVAGGLAGALLLLVTPAVSFDAAVPWLVWSATILVVIQRPLMVRLRRRAAAHAPVSSRAAGHKHSRKHLRPNGNWGSREG